jgi:HK97 family phage portal protein
MKTPIQWLKGRNQDRDYVRDLEALVVTLQTASSRAAAADVNPIHRSMGIGQDWTPSNYVDYYSKSVAVYRAINVRARALSRAPLKVFKQVSQGVRDPVPPKHKLQRLFDAPNPHMTSQDLVIATEVNLGVWGKAHWAIEHQNGVDELWPDIRPDRLHTLPGEGAKYIQGYRYQGLQKDVTYLPEEIVTFLYFNPAQDRAGHSPIAPLRMTTDMEIAATTYNRRIFQQGGVPDFVFLTEGSTLGMNAEIEAFYEKWEKRFPASKGSHRPAFMSGIKEISRVAFNQRDMEWSETLKWIIRQTGRAYGVPPTFMGDTSDANRSISQTEERIFWRTDMIPEAKMIEAKINQDLLPKIGWEGYEVGFDLSTIDVLNEEEAARIERESAYLDRQVVTPNEVRDGRGMKPLPTGDKPIDRQMVAPPK